MVSPRRHSDPSARTTSPSQGSPSGTGQRPRLGGPLRASLLAAALAGTLLATACAPSGQTGQSPTTTGTAAPSSSSAPAASAKLSTWSTKAAGPIDSFSWAVSGEPSTFDWTKDNSTHLARIYPNVVERLIWRAPDGKFEPALAESYAQPDPTTIVFTLREGVTFHDGSLFTAKDVVASLDRGRAKGSVWARGLASIASITPHGDSQVTVKLSHPDALLLSYLSTAAGSIESAAFLQKAGDKYGSTAADVDGTGPYSMADWTRGTSVTLTRNDAYWGTKGLSKTVDIKILQDSTTRNQALAAGEIDGSSAVSAGSEQSITSVGTGKDGDMYFGAGSSTWAICFFNSDGVLAKPEVRRALSMAVDRQGIVTAASGGNATPAGDFAAPGLWSDPAMVPKPLPQDIAGAKKLIEDAGATGSKLVLSYSAQSSTVTPMVVGVQAAAQAIGLDLQLKEVSTDVTNAFQADPASRKGTDLSVAQIGGPAYDPLEVYQQFTPASPTNFSGYDNPAVDSLLAEATAETDLAKRDTLLGKVRETLLADMPWIPLMSSPVAVYFGPKITGGPTSAAGTQNFPWAAYVGAR